MSIGTDLFLICVGMFFAGIDLMDGRRTWFWILFCGTVLFAIHLAGKVRDATTPPVRSDSNIHVRVMDMPDVERTVHEALRNITRKSGSVQGVKVDRP